MRKKIALFLAAIMVVGTLPMTAFAATDLQTLNGLQTLKQLWKARVRVQVSRLTQ